jgi:8-amino-7-oxononanoate synthase
LEDKIFARIVTFSKAYGFFGAAVLGNAYLIDYLLNFARSFIYSTALPKNYYTQLLAILKLDVSERISRLKTTIQLYNTNECYSPIQIIKASSLKDLLSLVARLNEKGIYQRPIFSPTVPKGQECIRLCFHSFNTKAEVNKVGSIKFIGD